MTDQPMTPNRSQPFQEGLAQGNGPFYGTAVEPPERVTLSRSARRRRARARKRNRQGNAPAQSPQEQLAAATTVAGRSATRAGRAPALRGRTGAATRAKGSQSSPSGQMPKADPPDTDVAAALGLPKGGLKGITPRQTLPVNANVLGALPWNFLPRRQYESYDLASLAMGEFGAQQLVDLLSDAWPEMSQALWNNLMLAKSDLKIEVRTYDNQHEDPAGKAELDAIIGRVNEHWGGFDALIAQLIMTTALQGACAGETIPTPDVDDVDDIVAVQPYTMYFQRDLQQKYIPFQWQPMLAASGAAALAGSYWDVPAEPVAAIPNPTAKAPGAYELLNMQALNHGGFRMLNTATFGYVPFLPDVDDPYGRLPFAPALQMVVFDAQLLKDLRQWAHTHAWGRLDVKVVAEMALKMVPPAVLNDVQKRADWLNQYLSDIVSAYNGLNADDTFVHWDNVVVEGVAAAGETFNVDNLVRIVERKVFRGLKQLPVLMGSNEGTTETHGTIQMEVYAKGITAIQHAVAALLEHLLTAALRLRGRTSVVQCEFEPLRTSDRIKDATAEAMEIKNAAAKRDQGWITQDEASIDVTGSKAEKDGPDPDPMVAALQPDMGSGGTPAAVPPPGQPGAPGAPAGTPPNPDAAKDDLKDDQADQADQAEKEAGAGTAAQVGNPPTAKLKEPAFPNQTGAAGATLTRSGDGRATSGDGDAESDPGDAPEHTGVMVAFFVDADAAEALALGDAGEGGEALPPGELHVTLTFHGDADRLTPDDRCNLAGAVAGYAAAASPLSGRVSGIGRFNPNPQSDGASAVYATVDVPGLHDWRAGLADALRVAGYPPATTFEYSPHITLAYVPADAPMPLDRAPENVPLAFSHVTLALGGERLAYRLGGSGDDPTAGEGAGRAAGASSIASTTPGPQATLPSTSSRESVDLDAEALERSGLRETMERRVTEMRAERAAARPPVPAQRTQLAHAARERVAEYLRAHRPAPALVKHIVALHTSRAVADNKRIWPDLADAVRRCADAAEARTAGAPPVPVSLPTRSDPSGNDDDDKQKRALIASIAAMLYLVYPQTAPDLATLLVEESMGAWDAAGAAALRRLGLPDQFHLTNQQLINAIESQGASDAAGITKTSRDRVAALIAQDLLDGVDPATIESDLSALIDGWGQDEPGSRANTISWQTVAAAWAAAQLMTWTRNRVPYKQWYTNGTPDPGSYEKPCQDNEDAGPIPIDQPFPTGAQTTPQHVGCYCMVDAAGDLSQVAGIADLWLGD